MTGGLGCDLQCCGAGASGISVCTNTKASQAHCGACNNACDSFKACTNGSCSSLGCNPNTGEAFGLTYFTPTGTPVGVGGDCPSQTTCCSTTAMPEPLNGLSTIAPGLCLNTGFNPIACGGCPGSPNAKNCVTQGGNPVCVQGNCFTGGQLCTTNNSCQTFGEVLPMACCTTGGVKACKYIGYGATNSCGSCDNVCGQGGNTGKPFCCPSGSTFACSASACLPPI